MFEPVVLLEASVVGGRSRYDKARAVSDHEAQEAWAYQELGGVLLRRSSLELDAPTRKALAEVLQATAIELNAGRAVPLGVRRAVWSVASALRIALDPPTRPAPPDRGDTSPPSEGVSPRRVTPPRFTAAESS
jgi:hypothetical protein